MTDIKCFCGETHSKPNAQGKHEGHSVYVSVGMKYLSCTKANCKNDGLCLGRVTMRRPYL